MKEFLDTVQGSFIPPPLLEPTLSVRMLHFELPVLLAEDFNVPAELDARELRKPRVKGSANCLHPKLFFI